MSLLAAAVQKMQLARLLTRGAGSRTVPADSAVRRGVLYTRSAPLMKNSWQPNIALGLELTNMPSLVIRSVPFCLFQLFRRFLSINNLAKPAFGVCSTIPPAFIWSGANSGARFSSASTPGNETE
jgi:hypothetical protein